MSLSKVILSSKIVTLCFVLFVSGLPVSSFASASTTELSVAESKTFFVKGKKSKSGKRKKNGRYKKRRGLFGKKNDCGCPKH